MLFLLLFFLMVPNFAYANTVPSYRISDREYLEYLKKKNKIINSVDSTSTLKKRTSGQQRTRTEVSDGTKVYASAPDPRSINKSIKEAINSKDPKAVDKLVEKKPEAPDGTVEKDQKAIPKTSSKGLVVGRKAGKYFAFAGSAIAYGTTTATGGETHERGTNGADSGTGKLKKTFKADIEYTPFADASLRFGWNFNSFAALTVPKFYRIELEVGYDRLATNVTHVGLSSDYNGSDFADFSPQQGTNKDDPVFNVPKNYGSGNLLHFGVNGYLDIAELGPGYPFVGGGFGLGVMLFDNTIQTNIIVPVFQVFAGYIFRVSKSFQISIAYKLTILFSSTFTNQEVIGMKWRGSEVGGAGGRPVVENLVLFDVAFIHKVEVGFYFF